MSQVIAFAETCPRCKQEQLQDRLAVADLVRLLYGGYPIKADCEFCDWTVSVQKRVVLGDFVAAACGAPLPTPPLTMVTD